MLKNKQINKKDNYNKFLLLYKIIYVNLIIDKCALTAEAPPDIGLTVRAAAFPAGFLTVNVEFTETTSISTLSAI